MYLRRCSDLKTQANYGNQMIVPAAIALQHHFDVRKTRKLSDISSEESRPQA
jgi:hypothetical protein